MQFDFTYKNHYQFGWGSKLYNFEDKTKEEYADKFWVKVGRAKYFPKSFKSECNKTAELIISNTSKPILICFSGGIDSEIIVRAFLNINASFEIGIMELTLNGTIVNTHDLYFAKKFCELKNLNYHTVSVSIDDFMKTEYEHYADIYKTYNIIGWVLAHRMIKLFPNHHTILGNGDIKLDRYKKIGIKKQGMYWPQDVFGATFGAEYSSSLNLPTVEKFRIYTPELILSWLMDPDISHWIKYEASMYTKEAEVNWSGIKAFAFYKHYPDMLVRPKLNGLETIDFNVSIFDVWRNMKEKYPNVNPNKIYIDYNDLYNMVCPK